MLSRCAASGGLSSGTETTEHIILRIYAEIDNVICFSEKTPALGRCAVSGGFVFQEQKASENIVMRIYAKIGAFVCKPLC